MVIAFVLALGMMSSLVACGSYELTNIVVTGVTTQYSKGDDVSFDRIKIKAKFNDGSEEDVSFSDCKVFLGDKDITSNLSKITETTGTKVVYIEYQGKTAKLNITVSIPGFGTIVSFESPTAYSKYVTATKSAGKKEKAYGEQGFESQFTTGDANAKDYLVGDDNNFKFLPELTYENDNGPGTETNAFDSITTIKMFADDQWVTLSTKAGAEENTVEYYLDPLDTTVYATAFTNKNEYDFVDGVATGKQFELSVLPSDDCAYTAKDELSPVSIVINVVDGYNIYTADQLAVIDNGEEMSARLDNKTGVYFWRDKKQENYLTGINPNAVILQNDIEVTADFLPDYFTYTLEEDFTYYRDSVAVEASKTFLREETPNKSDDDQTNILIRYLSEGETFAIHGNYFNLNLSRIPLVTSFDNGEADGYGVDGSNATFIKTLGKTDSGRVGTVSINNLQITGNANIDPLYDAPDRQGNPVFAGGLIFNKAVQVTQTYNNIIANTTLIPFFPESNSKVVIEDCKAYDSFNFAVYSWGKVDVALENCNFERAGGPLIFAQMPTVTPTNSASLAPTYTVDDDSILVNLVTGQEFWFNSNGATDTVLSLKALNRLFDVMYQNKVLPIKRSITDIPGDNGKLNVIFATLCNIGNGLTAAIMNPDTQAKFSYKGTVLDRMHGCDSENTLYAQLLQGNKVLQAGPSSAYIVDTTDPTKAFNPLTADLSGFATSPYLAINQGGIGILLGFFNA